MNIVNQALTAPATTASSASAANRAVQREGRQTSNDQVAFERLMGKDSVDDPFDNAYSGASDRLDEQAAGDSSARVSAVSGRQETADDTPHDSGSQAALQGWTPPYSLIGALPEIAQSAAPPAADMQAAWSEVSAHLERLFVASGSQPGGGPAALFTLRADLLADTAVSLTRVPHGWALRIDTRDWKLRGDTRQQEAALRDRFAQRGLGDLTIEQGELPRVTG